MRALAMGFALFSMFFGAGNLVFPLLLGETAGDQSAIAIAGLCMTAVLFPLLGLWGLHLLDGNKYAFFRPIGRIPGFLLLLTIHLALGPFGSIPRLFTLAHATLAPYFGLSLPLFSVIAAVVVLSFSIRKNRIVDILGYVLTPILILSLIAIVAIGVVHHPDPLPSVDSAGKSFWHGIREGYLTLDLLASLLFGQLILQAIKSKTNKKGEIKRLFLRASLIATVLLTATYAGLGMIASYHAHTLGEHTPETLLSLISRSLLGPFGGLIASLAVVMACLTTAISLVAIFAEFLQNDLLKNRVGSVTALVITLIGSGTVATLGFSGVMRLVMPALEVSYPVMILLTLWHVGVGVAKSGSQTADRVAP